MASSLITSEKWKLADGHSDADRRRRVYFDCDVFGPQGELLDQYTTCTDIAAGVDDFEAWTKEVGAETAAYLAIDHGERGLPRSVRIVLHFTFCLYFLDLESQVVDGANVHHFPKEWLPLQRV